MWFEALLGLRINLEKGELIPIGSVFDVRPWLRRFGVKWVLFLLLTLACLWEVDAI